MQIMLYTKNVWYYAFNTNLQGKSVSTDKPLKTYILS
jgi:hypothetical protein